MRPWASSRASTYHAVKVTVYTFSWNNLLAFLHRALWHLSLDQLPNNGWTRIPLKNSFIPLEGSFVPSGFPQKLPTTTRGFYIELWQDVVVCRLQSASHVTNSDCRPFDSFSLNPAGQDRGNKCVVLYQAAALTNALLVGAGQIPLRGQAWTACATALAKR